MSDGNMKSKFVFRKRIALRIHHVGSKSSLHFCQDGRIAIKFIIQVIDFDQQWRR